MKYLVQLNLFRASGRFAVESQFCAFRFWFSAIKEKRKML